MTPPHAPTLATLLMQSNSAGDLNVCFGFGWVGADLLAAWLAARGVRVASLSAPPEPTEAMIKAAAEHVGALVRHLMGEQFPYMPEDDRFWADKIVRAALRAASPGKEPT